MCLSALPAPSMWVHPDSSSVVGVAAGIRAGGGAESLAGADGELGKLRWPLLEVCWTQAHLEWENALANMRSGTPTPWPAWRRAPVGCRKRFAACGVTTPRASSGCTGASPLVGACADGAFGSGGVSNCFALEAWRAGMSPARRCWRRVTPRTRRACCVAGMRPRTLTGTGGWLGLLGCPVTCAPGGGKERPSLRGGPPRHGGGG